MSPTAATCWARGWPTQDARLGRAQDGHRGGDDPPTGARLWNDQARGAAARLGAAAHAVRRTDRPRADRAGLPERQRRHPRRRAGQRRHAVERHPRGRPCRAAPHARRGTSLSDRGPRQSWTSQLDPPIAMAYIVASNLINRSPDTRANARALAKLDFVVVHEPFLTPTARCADLVLPICTDLERATWSPRGGTTRTSFTAGRPSRPPAKRAPTTGSLPNWRSGWALATPTRRAKARPSGWSRFLDHRRGSRRWDAAALAARGHHAPGRRAARGPGRFPRRSGAHPLPTPSGMIEIHEPGSRGLWAAGHSQLCRDRRRGADTTRCS